MAQQRKRSGGGRIRWARFEVTVINTELLILRKKIEEFREGSVDLFSNLCLRDGEVNLRASPRRLGKVEQR